MTHAQLQRVRRICEAFPETEERLSHGEPTFFIRKKVYAMCANNHHGDGRIAVWLPAPPGMQAMLVERLPEKYFKPPYVGVRGCIGGIDVESAWRTIVWQQFGAAIDMLENAMRACPDELWSDRSQRPEFWYLVYHTLFFLDLYLSGSVEGFAPPAPFTLDELDPAGLVPAHPYTKDELHKYLEHGRMKCRATIEALTDEKALRRCRFRWGEVSGAELLLYNMRHVQHHAAQLNLLLRQRINSAPRWVAKAKSLDSGEGPAR